MKSGSCHSTQMNYLKQNKKLNIRTKVTKQDKMKAHISDNLELDNGLLNQTLKAQKPKEKHR